jgi:hypothetical protein
MTARRSAVAASFVVLGIVAIALTFVLFAAAGIWFGARAPRRVRCPDDGALAAVQFDARHSLRAFFNDESEKVERCSRWPEHAGCSRRCAERPETTEPS